MNLWKRGQISTFIIIGIALLLIVTAYFIFQSTSTPQIDIVTEVSDYQEVALVQTFVTACLQEVSEDAILLAGQQGGYTNLASVGITTSATDPTESDAFSLTSNSDVAIPYWHYLRSQNECDSDCVFFSQRPRLEGTTARSVEQQIKSYISRNMAICFQNFQAFQDQGYEFVEERDQNRIFDPVSGLAYPFDLEVLFRENDVKINMDYPLTISKGGITDTVSTYSVEHEVPFKRMFELASFLTAMELEYRFLGTQTVELISLNSGIDSQKLPPLGGATNEFTSNIFWLTTDVESKLQEILTVYTNAMRVQGAANFREITFPQSSAKPSLDRAFKNMEIPVPEQIEFSDVAVNFDYYGWPMYFNINDKNGIIEPDHLSLDFFPFFGIQRYRHYYDVSNPVRVSLRHSTARNGEGFTFAFGLENNVRNNEAMRESYHTYDNPAADAYSSPTEPQETLVCNFDQRNTESVTITVENKFTGDAIADAPVTFTCGEETCSIGVTNADGEVEGALPICGGATLSAFKQNAISGAVPITTSLGFDEDQVIPIEPIVEKEFSVKKHLIVKQDLRLQAPWVYGRLTDMDIAETVVVSVNRVTFSPFDREHNSVAIVESLGPDDPNPILRLVPGFYEVSIQSIINEDIYIPQSTRSEDGETYTIPEIDMSNGFGGYDLAAQAEGKFPIGFIKLDGTNMLWEVKADDLYDEDSTIEFYYAASDIANVEEARRVVEDIQRPTTVINTILADNTSMFMPRIIK